LFYVINMNVVSLFKYSPSLFLATLNLYEWISFIFVKKNNQMFDLHIIYFNYTSWWCIVNKWYSFIQIDRVHWYNKNSNYDKIYYIEIIKLPLWNKNKRYSFFKFIYYVDSDIDKIFSVFLCVSYILNSDMVKYIGSC
jgi:hypothetical protein